VCSYFEWISEQTAIISLYSIKLIVFITETETAQYELNLYVKLRTMVVKGLNKVM
jgi:hypothetical protein